MSNEYDEEHDLYGDIEEDQFGGNGGDEREEGENTRRDEEGQAPPPPRPTDWPADLPWPLPTNWRQRQPIIIVDQSAGNMGRKRDPWTILSSMPPNSPN
jgi:hypothetical protein